MKTMNSLKSAIAAKARMAISGILLVSMFLTSSSFAQSSSNGSLVEHESSRQSKNLSLKKFVGYYQLPDKASFIRFEVKDNTLFALWDNQEYQLIQINDTDFKSK